MRRVYEDPTEARARGTRAAEDVRTLHSAAPAGQIIAERLAVIRRRRANPGAIRSSGFLQDRVDELEARLTESVGTDAGTGRIIPNATAGQAGVEPD